MSRTSCNERSRSRESRKIRGGKVGRVEGGEERRGEESDEPHRECSSLNLHFQRFAWQITSSLRPSSDINDIFDFRRRRRHRL